MKVRFKLYSNGKSEYKSSIFDLIHGDRETKQTKSLGYILSQYEDFLFMFLNYGAVKREIVALVRSPLRRKDISAIEVSAERFTEDRKRADIVIKVDQDKQPLVALIIEAKSIKASVQKESLLSQITHYIQGTQFPGIEAYPRIPVVLTKYMQNIPGVACITWDDVIKLLTGYCRKKDDSSLIAQYLQFLLDIDKTMKYYEKEVLSIPAGKSIDRVEKHKIYECPDTLKYSYKKPLFICFRQGGGGAMDFLYKIEEIVVFNPLEKSALETFKNSTLPDNWKKRILNYIKATPFPGTLDHDKRFYILSEKDNIPLKNMPKPPRNNSGIAYYSLVDLLTKEVVLPEGRAKG